MIGVALPWATNDFDSLELACASVMCNALIDVCSGVAPPWVIDDLTRAYGRDHCLATASMDEHVTFV